MKCPVKVISRKGESVLVSWENQGMVNKAYIPASLIDEDGKADSDMLGMGIPYETSIWLYALRETEQYRDKAECISQALEQGGCVTDADLHNAPIRVGHVCGEDIYQIVQAILGVFDRRR